MPEKVTLNKDGSVRKKRAKTGIVCSMKDYVRTNHFPWDMAEITSENGITESIAVFVCS